MSAFFIQVSQVTAGQCPSLKHFPLLWLELHMEMGTWQGAHGRHEQSWTKHDQALQAINDAISN